MTADTVPSWEEFLTIVPTVLSTTVIRELYERVMTYSLYRTKTNAELNQAKNRVTPSTEKHLRGGVDTAEAVDGLTMFTKSWKVEYFLSTF